MWPTCAALILVVVAGGPKNLPPSDHVGSPPADMHCFDSAGYRELLKIDERIQSLIRMNEIILERVDEFERIIGNQQTELRLKRDAITVVEGENRRLYDEWSAEAQRRIELEERKSIGRPRLPWLIAGASALTAVVLGGILIVSRR